MNKAKFAGGVFALAGIGFLGYALLHPELSFPWPNKVTYTIYGAYALYTILLLVLPNTREVQFLPMLAFGFMLICMVLLMASISLPAESDYKLQSLGAAAFFGVLGNLTNRIHRKREIKKKTEKKE